MASRTNAMCASRSTPSSAAPFTMSSRFTARGVDVGNFSYQNMTAKTLGYR